MACVTKLSAPAFGMKFYYNVSAKVGPYASRGCINNPTDVELVNLLMSIDTTPWPGKMTPGIIRRGSTFDVSTGFLIYGVQDSADDQFTKSASPDGCVSVGNATGQYGSSTLYTIIALNNNARSANPKAWLKLFNEPGISPALKTQITHPYT